MRRCASTEASLRAAQRRTTSCEHALRPHDHAAYAVVADAALCRTHIIYLEAGDVGVDTEKLQVLNKIRGPECWLTFWLQSMGIQCVPARSDGLLYDSESVQVAFDRILSE